MLSVRASFALIRTAFALGIQLPRQIGHSPIHLAKQKSFQTLNIFPRLPESSYGAASRLPRGPPRVGRGFSTNQVQNAGGDSLWILDSSAQFVLIGHARATSCELQSIVMTSGGPEGSSTSRA
jgi:hypothetical protein